MKITRDDIRNVAIIAHVDDEDKRLEMLPQEAEAQNGTLPSGSTKTALINESGLYSLILSSKMPKAKAFKRWVTSEVLPALRKNGVYYLHLQGRKDCSQGLPGPGHPAVRLELCYRHHRHELLHHRHHEW